MWIFLSILAFLIALVAFILLLPVRITIKSDQNGEPQFLCRVLFFTFGKPRKKPKKKKGKKKSDGGELKKSLGVDRLSLKGLKQQIKEHGLKATVSQILSVIKDVFTEAMTLLRHCTAERFEFRVLVSGDDAAATAIKYGSVCAVIHPLITAIGSVITIKEKGTKIYVVCDYSGSDEKISYNFVIRVRVFRVLIALCRILIKTYARKSGKGDTPSPKDIVA